MGASGFQAHCLFIPHLIRSGEQMTKVIPRIIRRLVLKDPG